MGKVLEKKVEESRIFNFSFEKYQELIDGEILLDVISVTSHPTNLTLSPGVINGSKVQVRISGGLAGKTYTVICLVDTDRDNRLEGREVLRVT